MHLGETWVEFPNPAFYSGLGLAAGLMQAFWGGGGEPVDGRFLSLSLSNKAQERMLAPGDWGLLCWPCCVPVWPACALSLHWLNERNACLVPGHYWLHGPAGCRAVS